MFGSKIRSWMENHIVRPRKKGNKNKNANSTNVVTTNGGLANGPKAIPSHGESSIGCSSARRSEVSPIQNHTTSRFGWQSPQDDYHCPNTVDGNYSYHVKSTTTSPKTIYRYNNLSNGGGSNANSVDSPHHHLNKSQYSKSVDAKYMARTYEEQRPTYQLQNKDILPGILKTSTNGSSGQSAKSTEMVSKPTINFTIDSPIASPYRQRPNSSRRHDEMHGNGAEYREHAFYDDRGQYGYNQRTSQSPQMYANGSECYRSDDVHAEKPVKRGIYGKIMNGKLLNGNHRDESHSAGNKRSDRPIPMLPPPPSTPPPPQTDKYSSYNRYNEAHSNGGRVPEKRNPIENPYDVPSDAFYAPNEMKAASPRDLRQKRVLGTASSMRTTPSPQQSQQQVYQHKVQFMNGSHVSASSGGSHHPLAHAIMNSLSSPESAYSTGYSTDGTSPGTSNAPEYYINMRTGTHYFPRGVTGVAAVERNCQKFGLNKIEETASEVAAATTTSTTTISAKAATTVATTILSNHRRTESCDLGKSKLRAATALVPTSNDAKTSVIAMRAMSPDAQRRLAYQNYRGFESPSPRQRCRIRTNPWLSIADGSGSNAATMPATPKIMDCETGSTSSGVKSNSDAGVDEKNWLPNGKNLVLSESDSSTSTEIEMIRKSFSPRRRRLDKQMSDCLPSATLVDSEDEDATFNELMGKFDESYVYEKETDILSDSDPTECASEFDTGQDGGDECDLDEMPDINYIDTESIQEICDRDGYQNTGSCTYHQLHTDRQQSKLRKRSESGQSGRRKKRLTRTRKRNSECRERDNSLASSKTISPSRSRGSRSVGGTPMSLRRNQKEKQTSRFLAIAESEKAILKADIEADVKYKQLIHEAETILVSMKTTALRETPVPSPSRRICHVPPNKRVEMLRTCEVDLRRELSKSGKCDESPKKEPMPQPPPQIEVPSIPSSPTFGSGNVAARYSPRKTHITNFMHQNDMNMRHLRVSEPHSPERHYEMKRSPALRFDGLKFSPPKSPMPRRRFRSQSPRFFIEESDTESDQSAMAKKPNAFGNRNKENKLRNPIKKSRPQPIASPNRTANKCINGSTNIGKLDAQVFRAIEISSSPDTASGYCPQSEPLKRKIYSEKTLDRLQKSLEVEAEVPRQELLQKISMLRRERQQSVASSSTRSYSIEGYTTASGATHNESYHINNVIDKRLLILNTIEDLKRNLEEQSIELCDLNGDE